jgi:hypothetical protein
MIANCQQFVSVFLTFISAQSSQLHRLLPMDLEQADH